jgi:DNA-binding CsgD family transcriptional regulator
VQLVGRRTECCALEEVLAAVRAGESRALVVCGEAGIGKTALLDELIRRATGCRVIRISGLESEMELAFAALHQLCTPLLGQIDQIPAPQGEALLTAFGKRAGAPPDPFLLGLATLSLVAEAAADRPLLLLVDDEQWLDRSSARAIAFVARRVEAESVGIVFATRCVGKHLGGLRELPIRSLQDEDSRTLLSAVVSGPLDIRVRDQIIAEARGNPLALLELPRTLTRAELAGGFGPPGAPFSHSLDATFRRQVDALPTPTRLLLALAAADPTGDPSLLWRAAEVVGLSVEAAVPAIEAGLAEIGTRVRFRHPLVRASAYRSVPLSDRRRIHGALAAVTDAGLDPDRRAWHLGHAAVGPDEAVADELERAAERVQARGGIPAAAAFLERASVLTLDPARRGDRILAAASAKAQAGLLDEAKDLLTVAESVSLSSLQTARADLIRAQLAFVGSRGNDAAPWMLGAARRLEIVDPQLARDTYLDALAAAIFAGRLGVDGDVLEVSKAASAATCALTDPRPPDLLLHGLSTQHSADFEKGLPTVQQALRVYGQGMSAANEMRWMFVACVAAARIWDLDRLMSLASRYITLARDTGALTEIPLALSCEISPLLFTGRFGEAAVEINEMAAVIDAMGTNVTPYGELSLAAMRGRRHDFQTLRDAAVTNAQQRGEGVGLTVVAWATALLENGYGNYPEAVRAGRDATAYACDCTSSGWALVELVEAAARAGEADVARDAFHRLAEMTTPSGTDWGLGVQARSQALLSAGDEAERLYLEALDRLARAGLQPDLARAHLLYGEWLRRQRRRIDARTHLHAADELFAKLGMEAFAQRTQRELLATGEKAPSRVALALAGELTAREAQIALMARDGLSNPEIGARLFISARTVQYHLAKVFTKLDIRSRSQLGNALSNDTT